MASLRDTVALSSRILAACGHDDLIWGHSSCRDPQGRGAWLKSADWGLAEVTAGRVHLVSGDGEVLEGTGPRHSEYPIHTEIYAARSDVGGIVHTHPPYSIGLAATGQPLRPLSHAATMFVDRSRGSKPQAPEPDRRADHLRRLGLPGPHAHGGDMTDIETGVLVVGTGPAGATAALALASYGVPVLALNKYGSTSPTPRAHITNQRAMEILREFGLERQAMAAASPHDFMRDNVCCTSLAGQELGRIEAWSTHPLLRAQHDLASPCLMVDLTQEMMEPIIVTEATRRGAKVRTDTELLSFTTDSAGVTATVRDRLSGSQYRIRASYLIGADGGNSRVVEQLGLPLEGRSMLGAAIGIGFRADLSRYLEHRPGDMYWMIQPGHGILGYGIGSLRLVRAWDRWIGNWGYDPAEPPPQFSDAEAIAIVHRLLGDETIPVELETITTWTMNQIHATRLRAGRVFAMGDAVHRHPPMNGLGSNTALQDAFNLAWKLAMVLAGKAGDELLDSYDAERQPVAEALVKKSMGNMAMFGQLAAALGLTRQAQDQAEMDALIDAFSEPTTAGMRRRTAFREAMASWVYGFSAVGGEHNLRYTSGAVIPDGLELTVEDPELQVILGLQSGRRVPHVWLTENQQRVSTLDLCGGKVFTLLTGLAGRNWTAAAQEVSGRLGVPVRVHVVGPRQRYEDPYGDFGRICLPDETGAILVRPDHVVAWHVAAMPGNPAGALYAALSSVLGLPPPTAPPAPEEMSYA